MKKPLANLKTQTIDEQIEQMLQVDLSHQNDEDARYLQDLRYLLRKEEVLERVQARLMLAGQLDETLGSADEPGTMHDDSWQERVPLPLPPRGTRIKFSWSRIAIGLAAALLLISMIGVMLFFDARSPQIPGTSHAGTPTVSTATVLFADPLNANTHHWSVLTSGPCRYLFQNGAYHIVNQGPDIAVAVQPDITFRAPWSYTLSMTQVQGNNVSSTSSFGIVFAYTSLNGAMRFTSLEVTNIPGQPGASKLSLDRYDTSKSQPLTELWSTTHLTAFHAGLHQANTIKIIATAQNLRLIVNNQQISILRFQVNSGSIGMLVKGQGSEVAFQNLMVTRP